MTKPYTEVAARSATRGAKSSDLTVGPLPVLDWQRENVTANLEALYRWVESSAVEAYGWYMREKASKSRISKAVRIIAVLLLTTGGVMPILSLITNRHINGEWGFVALAVGAGTLLLDRAFGYSSSWTRYALSGMELKAALANAQLNWMKWQIMFSNSTFSDSQASEALDEIIKFAFVIDDVIRRETEQWVIDFRENLTELRATIGSHPR